MLVTLDPWIFKERLDIRQGVRTIAFRDKFEEFSPDQFFSGFIEIPAVSFVDKGDCSVRQVTADQFCLRLDHISVTLFALG